jgi:hypothetical protein
MNTETIITLVGIVLGSNWLGQFLMELYKSKKKKKTPTEIILKAIARHHLLTQADKYKEQGYIDSEEYNDVFEEYAAYIALEGNGRVKREYGEGGELRSLPVE